MLLIKGQSFQPFWQDAVTTSKQLGWSFWLFWHDLDVLSIYIKGSLTVFLTLSTWPIWMISLTQLVTTSKACQHKGVNLVVKLVTFMMDIKGQAVVLRKKLEKLNWQLGNEVLTGKQTEKKEKEIKEIESQIEALGIQLTSLRVTKVVHTTHQWGGYHKGPRA